MYNAYLAMPMSEEENKHILDVAKAEHERRKNGLRFGVWIGVQYQENMHRYEYANGEPVVYFNWERGKIVFSIFFEANVPGYRTAAI